MKKDKYGKPFSSRGYIESNLKGMYEEFVEKGTDQLVFLVIGKSNSTKTSLSLLMQQYLNNGVNLDCVCLNHDEWVGTHTTRPNPDAPPKKKIIYEEGRDSFFRTNSTTKENKEAKNIIYEYRAYQNVLFINFQNAADIEPDLPMYIADGLFRTVKPGWTWFYGKQSMKSMWSDDRYKRFEGWDTPDFRDGYPDPANFIPEQWEAYNQQNLEKLDNSEKGEQKKDEEDEIDLTDEKYYSVATIADLLDYTKSGIRRTIRDGDMEAVKLNTGALRVAESELKKFMKKESVDTGEA